MTRAPGRAGAQWPVVVGAGGVCGAGGVWALTFAFCLEPMVFLSLRVARFFATFVASAAGLSGAGVLSGAMPTLSSVADCLPSAAFRPP